MDDPQSAPQSPVKEGDVLAGKYRVEKVLGVGGMGVVVAAMHTELDERVALKFLQAAAAQNPQVVARFNREARAAAKIKSQHVARVIDVGTLEIGTPYIVMEYLDGKDLSDVLAENGPLPVGVAVDYVLQACEAIAEAHAVGFIHRDLKPPNLFLAQQPNGEAIIKVLDFGISKAVIADEPSSNRGALTGTTDIFGSPTYMSPEQLKASRDVDARADIWGLGVILYELISGRAPFDRNTVAETFGAILFEQPVSLRKLVPAVPADLDRVVLRCLEKERDARLSNIAELVKALLPYAASATRASFDRTSRILRRAGVTIESVPPPAGVTSGGARAQTNLPVGAQTRSTWDTASQIPTRPRSGSRSSVIIGVLAGVVVAGGAGVFLMRRFLPPAGGVTAAAKPVITAPSVPETPSPPVTATPSPPETPKPPATAVAVTPASMGDAPKPPALATSGAPTVAPSAPVTPGQAPKAPVRGKLPGRQGKPAAAATATAAAAAPKPPKPPDDDFNDRK